MKRKGKLIDWGLVFAFVAFGILGVVADRVVVHYQPKPKQCADIGVDGTVGVSTMSVVGNTLYLTGVKDVRCELNPTITLQHQNGF